MKMVFWEVALDKYGKQHKVRIVADPVRVPPGVPETWAQLDARYFLDDDRELELVDGDRKRGHLKVIGTDEIVVLQRRS
jgi:hypothetical protein